MRKLSDARDTGYVTDVAYVATFIPELAPAWLDHVAIVQGFVPPSRQEGFDWCDLGCGLGATATILAATHPSGRFVGIDFMKAHIDCAKRLATEAGVGNVVFFHADFATATELGLPKFDYIVIHGVYAWVDERRQQEIRSFIRRHVKPGGLVYISYNALPGRASDVAFQRLFRVIARDCPGDSLARVFAATALVREMARLKAPALDGSFAQAIQERAGESVNVRYLAHELMTRHWRPLFVTDVRECMAEIELTPVGSASLMDNYDAFVLGRAARAAIAVIKEGNARELARDFFLNQCFRRDVFVYRGRALSDAARQTRLFDSTFCLAQPSDEIEYSAATPAGRLSFNNAYTRRIAAGLASGPQRLARIVGSPRNVANLLANVLVMCAATMVRPVEGSAVPVKSINDAILRRLDGPEELLQVALPCGTSLSVDRSLLRLRRDRAEGNTTFAGWRDFLDIHGAGDVSPGFF